MNNFQNSKILSRNNNNYLRDKINIFNMKKYSIVNRFLTPNKRLFILKYLDSDNRDNRFNKQINYNLIVIIIISVPLIDQIQKMIIIKHQFYLE